MADMEIDTHDDILRKAALDGSMDYSSWPNLLPDVLERIEKIAHAVFPVPNVPQPRQRACPTPPPFSGPPPSSGATIPNSSQETNKENASPTATRTTSDQGVPSSAAVASSQPQDSPAPGALPKLVQEMLNEILSVLRTNFNENPPHTIQRLSELVLQPRKHYKSVVAWLHALDRVVHVTSGANIYPLPPAIPDMSTISLGSSSTTGIATPHTAATSTVGTDEALGGALLTPIPWLAHRANGGPGSDSGSDAEGSSSPLSPSGLTSVPSAGPSQHVSLQQRQLQQGQSHQLDGRVRTESTETIEGPNGMGRIETVSISVNGIPSTGAGGVGAALAQRGITQGELLRQEQRAGVVPMSQLARQQQEAQVRVQNAPGEGSGSQDEDATMSSDPEEEETPHARGPEEIGLADMGPQPAGAATTLTIGTAGGAVESRGINVEAAVGRPPDQTDAVSAAVAAAQKSAAAARSGTPEPEIIPRSPKREASNELPGSATKKSRSSSPKLDAEGDLALPDSDAQSKPEEQRLSSPKEGEETAASGKRKTDKTEQKDQVAAAAENDDKRSEEEKKADDA